MLECCECTRPATRVLVDYRHNIIGDGVVFCEQHAGGNGRAMCPCCFDNYIEVNDQNGDQVELLPVYPAGTLDAEGCCADHP
jgi:hypothetical protein